jgi:hypothetical protein
MHYTSINGLTLNEAKHFPIITIEVRVRAPKNRKAQVAKIAQEMCELDCATTYRQQLTVTQLQHTVAKNHSSDCLAEFSTGANSDDLGE